MARLEINGMDSLARSFSELLSLSHDAAMEIVMAGAEAAQEGQKRYLRQHHYRTGDLSESITIRALPNFTAARVEATGVKTAGATGRIKLRKAHRGSGATRRVKHHGLSKGTSMQDVAYYLAMGTSKLRATSWDVKANAAADTEITRAMEAAWNKTLDSLDL